MAGSVQNRQLRILDQAVAAGVGKPAGPRLVAVLPAGAQSNAVFKVTGLSVFMVSPSVLGWQNYLESRKRSSSAPAPRLAAMDGPLARKAI